MTTTASATLSRTVEAFYADVDDPRKNKADLGAYFVDDFVDFDRSPMAAKALSDKEAHLSFFDELKAGFSDYSHTLNLVEETLAGKLVVYWTFEGTHSGPFFGAPASRRPVRINGIDIYTMAGDKFAEQRHCEDVAGLLAQIARPDANPEG